MSNKQQGRLFRAVSRPPAMANTTPQLSKAQLCRPSAPGCLSILPELVLQKTSYKVAILPVKPVITRKIGVVMKEKNALSIASKYFLDFLSKHVDELK